MRKQYSFLLLALTLLLSACSSEDESMEGILPPAIAGLESEYTLLAGEELTFAPTVENGEHATCLWTLDGAEVSREATYTFLAGNEAYTHTLSLQVSNEAGKDEKTARLNVISQGSTVTLEAQTYTVVPIELNGTPLGGGTWKVTSAVSDLYRLTGADTDIPSFIAAREGRYILTAENEGSKTHVLVNVKERSGKLTSNIASVLDYMPAPGQFVNVLPEYEEGDTHEDMVRKAGEWLGGDEAYAITLGGWGGYVVVGFDHTIPNVAGLRDFRINGNAFDAVDNGRPDAPKGGSCEPGIVMVAYDKNKNGRPDEDEWYEIAGSGNFTTKTEAWYSIAVENGNDTDVFRDYEMTYYRPTREEPEESAEPDNPLAYITIKDYIRWTDNRGNNEYKVKNVYHTQTYYPAWVDENQLTFHGIRLANNAINEGKFNPGINSGSVYFVLYSFRYGYVDNSPNVDDNSAIDIDWAVDREGNPVELPGVDFIKVYNGVNQENGWLGECSTEVERGEDLHMQGKRIPTLEE